MKNIFILPVLFFVSVFQISAQENTKKAEELKEVTITKTKKAIEQKADRTIFDFAKSNAHHFLNCFSYSFSFLTF